MARYADGSDRRTLTNNAGPNYEPFYSPDGKTIIFESDATDNFEIFSMRSDGSHKRNLTKNPAADQDPAFSPSGRRIAFDSDRNGGVTGVFTMRSDGTHSRQVTHGPFDEFPHWGRVPG